MKNTGLKDFYQTQFHLPSPDIKNTNYRNLIRLPSVLAHCYQEHTTLLESATQASNYPELTEHPGRLLDTLLFMQGLKEKENPDFKIFQYS